MKHMTVFGSMLYCGAFIIAFHPLTARAQKPVQYRTPSSQTQIHAQAASYHKVRASASRFEKDFQNVPTTPHGINALLARMEKRQATQDEMHELRAHLMGNRFAYLVTSAMVARAANEKERALCRCFHGTSMAICFSDDPPDWLMGELQDIVREAVQNGIHKENPAVVGSVVINLGIEHARRNQLDEAWSVFARHRDILERQDYNAAAYIRNMAHAIRYVQGAPQLSKEVEKRITQYLEEVLRDNKRGTQLRGACEELRSAIDNLNTGGGSRIQSKT